jgi:hypothetical protein
VNEVWRATQQNLALAKGFRNQAELVLLEISQTAVDQFAACRTRRGTEISLFNQQDSEASSGGIPCDAGTVDAAADDQEIELAAGIHADCSSG